MRILRVADVPDNRTGGMSRAMYNVGDALNASGDHVDYLFHEDLSVSGPATLRRFTVPFKIPEIVRRLAKSGKSYDVVEIHEPLAAVYCYQRLHDKKLPPAVVFSHGLEERGRRAELAYLKSKNLPINIKKRYSSLSVIWQAMYAVRHADQVVCLNKADFDYLKKEGVADEHLKILHSGVDTMFLETASGASQQQGNRTGILFLGSWLIRKGSLDLVPAVTEVLRHHPLQSLTIAGCGSAGDYVLNEFADDVKSRVHVVPKIENDEDLIKIYQSHSIFLLPSYFEGHPLVMIEAAAMGMAIVTTDICGMADFIQDGVNGLLIDAGDVQGLTDKVEALVNDPELIRSLGRNAMETAKAYGWSVVAEKLLAIYESAVSGSQRTSINPQGQPGITS